MTDLLREFVELAPEEWGAVNYEGHVVFNGSSCIRRDGTLVHWPTIKLHDDRASAEALIFLLDWLEGEEKRPELRVWSGGYCVALSLDPDEGKWIRYEGKTRIEAVLRAVVQVLKEKQVRP